MKKHLLALLALTVLIGGFSTVPVQAQRSGSGPAENSNLPRSGSGPAEKEPANQGLKIKLDNPLSGISTIPEAINKILSIVIRIALPIIIIAFIWSGLKFIFARGNPKELETAKNMFLYTVIGTLLILGAWTITNAIVGTVNSVVN